MCLPQSLADSDHTVMDGTESSPRLTSCEQDEKITQPTVLKGFCIYSQGFQPVLEFVFLKFLEQEWGEEIIRETLMAKLICVGQE